MRDPSGRVTSPNGGTANRRPIRLPRITFAEMLGIVATAAFGCFMIRFWEFFAGGMTMAMVLLIGLVRILGNRSRRRPFWAAFGATGLPMLLVYLVCHRLWFNQLIVPWTYRVFDGINRNMANMPDSVLILFNKYL